MRSKYSNIGDLKYHYEILFVKECEIKMPERDISDDNTLTVIPSGTTAFAEVTAYAGNGEALPSTYWFYSDKKMSSEFFIGSLSKPLFDGAVNDGVIRITKKISIFSIE